MIRYQAVGVNAPDPSSTSPIRPHIPPRPVPPPAERLAHMRFRIIRRQPIPIGPDEPREGLRRPCTMAETLRRCPQWSIARLVELYDMFHRPEGGGDDGEPPRA